MTEGINGTDGKTNLHAPCGIYDTCTSSSRDASCSLYRWQTQCQSLRTPTPIARDIMSVGVPGAPQEHTTGMHTSYEGGGTQTLEIGARGTHFPSGNVTTLFNISNYLTRLL